MAAFLGSFDLELLKRSGAMNRDVLFHYAVHGQLRPPTLDAQQSHEPQDWSAGLRHGGFQAGPYQRAVSEAGAPFRGKELSGGSWFCQLGAGFRSVLLLLALACSTLIAGAQQPGAPPGDLLMQLMQSQLPVDVISPVTAKTECDPGFLTVGQKAIYRVTLNALDVSVQWPRQMPLPEGLKMTLAARGQVQEAMGTTIRPQTTLNFHLTAERPGFYRIPAFTIEVYGKPVTVPEASLQVVAGPVEDAEYARQLVLQPLRTNLFVGESLRVRVLTPATISNVVETLTQLQFNGDGFQEDKVIYYQKVETILLHGRRVQASVIESSIMPLATGPQTLSVQAFTAGRQFLGPVVLRGITSAFAAQSRQVLLDSEPVTINVQPLPPEGTAKGFTGFIGKLSVERPQLNTNSLRIGDVATLRVTFRSRDGFARFTPPPPPRVPGWQIFPPTPTEPAPPATPLVMLNSSAAFAYAMIPMSEEIRQTPAIPFRFFDPDQGEYVEATIPPVDVSVVAGDLPADWKPVNLSADEPSRKRKATLSEFAASPGKTVATLVPLQLQAWFGLVQLAPALAFGGLWYWDRRRRFLEAHPEIVRCRLARRALRREKRALRQAAAGGDAPGFVRRAVAALQIAAAPHFPAAPRALVCSEVLSLFDGAEQGGRTGEVIRLFFAREADQTFAAKPESAGPLFELRADLEKILEKMEARL